METAKAKKVGTLGGDYTEEKAKTANASLLYSYTAGCNVYSTADHKLTIAWANGAAISATRGATIDYVPKHMFVHLTTNKEHYAIFDDYAALVAGQVNPKLAWIVCLLREVVFSLEAVALNDAETVIITKALDEVTVDPQVTAMMRDHGMIVSSIVQQALTIFALNGESLLGRGHHYNDADVMWKRFDAATNFDESCSKLGLVNYEGVIFHDTMHPFDYDWMAALVTDEDSVLRSHINGVALKRLGTLPAGTTVLGLYFPLLDEVRIRNATLGKLFDETSDYANGILERVKKAPLDYCIHLPRTKTAENLKSIANVEPAVALLYGYLRGLNQKKLSVLMAKSLPNIAGRHPIAYSTGVQAASAMAPIDKTAETLQEEIVDLLRRSTLSADNNQDREEDPKEEQL